MQIQRKSLSMQCEYTTISLMNQTINRTPAEAADINLNLGENRVESMMRQVAVYAKDVQKPTVKGLGICAYKVQILDESDWMKVSR
jgi:hypothetical protein